MVLRLEQGVVFFLLPGDLQQHGEDRLVRDHAFISANFLKAPHHGSRTSSTELFLSAVHPQYAVFCVGEANPFGHPNEAIVERYADANVRIYRTDRDGTVTAITDGDALAVHTFAESLPH